MPVEHRPDLPRLPLPDPLATRRALSDVRSVMRHGLDLARDGLDQAPLPPPVAAITGSVLRRVDDIAQHAEAVARVMVDGLLGTGPASGEAGALAEALRQAASGLGGHVLRVDDAAVRVALEGGPAKDPETAARMMCRLLEGGALRPADPMGAVAIFAAVMAQLQSPGGDATLSASRALAEALAPEIAAAGTDGERLARLFAEFRDHV